MNANDFRRLALELPEAVEGAHMDHPDFRVGNKIFASLSSDKTPRGMVKLTAEQQAAFMKAEPKVFEPCNGAWGRWGATYVSLAAARTPSIRHALALAWRNTAPKRLIKEQEEEV